MEKIRVMFDKQGNTLDVWFEEPREAICEETGNGVILKKDFKTGKVIGFEKLNILSNLKEQKDLPVEVIMS
ncbi:DUF2283 domain-containing protein [Candidatus Woesearchaeota archaeon]|nr:DUF2283 domain-containing protein [Candidatus Woesearchaeota archaeon]